MSAYDVMDGLLRTSLVEESTIMETDSPLSDFEVELDLIDEGDTALLGLWYAVAGRSLVFEQDYLPSWMTDSVLIERDESDIRAEIAHHTKALNAVKGSDKAHFSFTRKSLDADPKTGKPREEEATRSRGEHIQHLERKLKTLHKELESPGAVQKPIPAPVHRGRFKTAKLGRSVPPAEGPWSPSPRSPSSGEGGPDKPEPSKYVSDDPKSAYHVPLFSEPGERGLAHRGKVQPVPPTKKAVEAHKKAVKRAEKKGLPTPADLPKRVARALPGQTITKGTGQIGQAFPFTQAMGTTIQKPVPTPERSKDAAREAAKRLPSTKPDEKESTLTRGHPGANSAIHTTMHVINGIKDPHHLTPREKAAVGRLVQSHGHHMGMGADTSKKGVSSQSLSARDQVISTFLGTGSDASEMAPYHGIKKTAELYVKRHSDPRSAPDNAHDQVAALIRDRRKKFAGYHHATVKRSKAAGTHAQSLTGVSKETDKEGEKAVKGHVQAELGSSGDGEDEAHTSPKPLWRGSGTRGTGHMARHERLGRVHDVLAGRYDPEHAERLRSHFELHDSKERIAHHNAKIADLREKMKGAEGSSKAALSKEMSDHVAAHNSEGKRHAKANSIRDRVQSQIERQQAAMASMKLRHKKEGKDAGHTEAHPHMQAMHGRLKQLQNLHQAIETPEGHQKYRVFAHIMNAGMGGHGDYDLEHASKTAEPEKAEESISLFDTVFEAEEPGEAPKPKKTKPAAEVIPGHIGKSGMPEHWKGAIAAHLGIPAYDVSRSIKDLFTGSAGEDMTKYVIGTGEARKTFTRTPREKGLFVQAAREGKTNAAGGGKLARTSFLANRDEIARAKLRTGWSKDLTPGSGRKAAPTFTITPEQRKKKEAAAEKTGEEHRQFAALSGRMTPEEAQLSKGKQIGSIKMSPEEIAQRVADAKSRRKAKGVDAAAAAQRKRDAELAHIGMAPDPEEPKPKKKNGDDEDEVTIKSGEESVSLFGLVFAESRRGASLFEAVLA